jgi:hypothetical protein
MEDLAINKNFAKCKAKSKIFEILQSKKQSKIRNTFFCKQSKIAKQNFALLSPLKISDK